MPYMKCECGQKYHISVVPDWYRTATSRFKVDPNGYFLSTCFECYKKLLRQQKLELNKKELG